MKDLHFVVPSKRVQDIVWIHADFQELLLEEEEILSCLVTVQVFAGLDPDPGNMVYQIPVISRQIVSQRIREGLPGVIYTVIFQATTSFENIITLTVEQAVLIGEQSLTPIEVILQLSSRPYPIDILEALQSSAIATRGLILPLTLDGMDSSMLAVEGELRSILQQYTSPPEGIDSSMIQISGELRTILKTYVSPPEGIDSSMVVLTGNLDTVLISYTCPLEGIDSSMMAVSGVLG